MEEMAARLRVNMMSPTDFSLVRGDRGYPSVGVGTAQAARVWRGAVAELSACAVDARRRCLPRVADAGSVLLRACGGWVAALTEAVGFKLIVPHVQIQTVQQNFDEVKQRSKVLQFLQVWLPVAPVRARSERAFFLVW